MFSIALYLAEKITSLIPWRSAASVLETTSADRGKRIGGGDSEERVGAGSEGGEWEEVERLRKLLEEVRIKEEESGEVRREVEELRGEVVRLKRELEGGQSEKVKGKQRATDEEVTEPSDPCSVKQDTASEDDVILLLQSLNGEIMEVAQSIARAFTNVRRPAPPLPSDELSEDLKEAIGGATEILGPAMVELLQAPQRRGMSGGEGAVRMALKASMAAYTHWIISSWYFENPEDEHLLSEIYARVRETEEQEISGHWRALTRVHLQRMLAAEPDLTIYMVDAFVNIILTAGWHNDAVALQDYLIQTFGQKIGGVLEKAKKLNKVIGEEIIKCDLEALYIAPDVVFNVMTMDVVNENDGVHVENQTVGGGSEKRVLCTTELGLVKAEKKLGKVGEWEEAVLLKPSVILQASTLDSDAV
ncbi:hypothetical protein AN958_10574 [Leucoagaricus sp. SymC.cos]|nr:hypothetical protein AN958_10574 [Leucoagaricus sp. SymC.cos]